VRVLIVGSGPGGLSCALVLLGAGADVDIVEARDGPDVGIVCGGGLSFWMMRRVGLRVPDGAVLSRIGSVTIRSPGEEYTYRGDEMGVIIDRGIFQSEVAEEVERLGGNLTYGVRVGEPELSSWVNDYDYIVGADGPTSAVRRFLGLPRLDPGDMCLGIQATVEAESESIEIWFGRRVAPGGYLWVFPAGDVSRVGLGIPLSERANPRRLLERFIGERYGPERVVGLGAKLIPVARMPGTGVHGKFVLVGDALPSCDPLTGGGICQAWACGSAAARAIAEGRPEMYGRYISWLRRQNNLRYGVKEVLAGLSDAELDGVIRAVRGLEPSGDMGRTMNRAVLRFLVRNPHLIPRLLRAFL
jgi:digeranylgeranylglycerophospholipid reductase